MLLFKVSTEKSLTREKIERVKAGLTRQAIRESEQKQAQGQ